MRGYVLQFGLLIIVAVLASSALGADKTAELQARFDRETKAVPKAKLLEKLGDAQFAAAREVGHQGDYSTAGQMMEKFRDNARACVDVLLKQQPDAERHPNGFRQAEISLRRGIREVDELMLVAPDVYRPPLQQVRSDLISMDDELLRALFPRRPDAPPAHPAANPAAANPAAEEKNP